MGFFKASVVALLSLSTLGVFAAEDVSQLRAFLLAHVDPQTAQSSARCYG